MTWIFVIIGLSTPTGPIFIVRQGGFSDQASCERTLSSVEAHLLTLYPLTFSDNCVPEDKK